MSRRLGKWKTSPLIVEWKWGNNRWNATWCYGGDPLETVFACGVATRAMKVAMNALVGKAPTDGMSEFRVGFPNRPRRKPDHAG